MRGAKAKRLRKLAYQITPRAVRGDGYITIKGTVFAGVIKETELDQLRHTEYNADPVVMDMLSTIEALWKVARAAERLIYPLRGYAPGSKKAALRDALEALKSA